MEGLTDFLAGLRGQVTARKQAERDVRGWWDLGFREDVFRHHVARCFKIEDKASNAMLLWGPLFLENNPQMRAVWTILNAMRQGGPTRILFLKNRKVGVSTAMEMLLLSLAIQCKGVTCGIVAHTEDSANKLFSMIRAAYDNLPPDMKRTLPLRFNSETRMQFGTKEQERIAQGDLGHVAQLKCQTAGGSHPFAGDTVRALHMSECAKYDAVGDYQAQQRFILNAMGAVPKSGPSLIIAESTANGQQGWFYETWTKASSNEAVGGVRWIPVFIPWMSDPACTAFVPEGYDWSRWYQDDLKTELDLVRVHKCTAEQLMFRRNVIATEMNGNFDLFDQEFPTTAEGAFLASGRPAVPRRYVKAMESTLTDEYARYTARVIDGYQGQLSYSVEDT